MNDNPQISPVLDDALDQARRELGDLPSIREQVEHRIASTPMSASPWRLAPPLLTIVAVVLVFIQMLVPVRIVIRSQSPDFQLTLGDTELTEHLAALIGDRTVLVIWSCRGATIAPEVLARKYRLLSIRDEKLAPDRTLVCSLFLADPGVHPVLEPPSVCARSTDGNTISFTSSPRAASAAALGRAIALAGASPATADNILNEINQYTH